MKYYMIVFSPTGGTEKVAKAITKNWKQIETIDLTLLILITLKFLLKRFASPDCDAVFWWCGTVSALERLSMLKAMQCVLLHQYLDHCLQDTLLQMQDYAQTSGFQVILQLSPAVAEHSIIRKYAAGRPNLNDYKELSEFGNRILKKLLLAPINTCSSRSSRPFKKAKELE